MLTRSKLLLWLFAVCSRCTRCTRRHFTSTRYRGNSPLLGVLCFCSALFHSAAGQPTLAKGCAKTHAPRLCFPTRLRDRHAHATHGVRSSLVTAKFGRRRETARRAVRRCYTITILRPTPTVVFAMLSDRCPVCLSWPVSPVLSCVCLSVCLHATIHQRHRQTDKQTGQTTV